MLSPRMRPLRIKLKIPWPKSGVDNLSLPKSKSQNAWSRIVKQRRDQTLSVYEQFSIFKLAIFHMVGGGGLESV